MFDTRKFLVNDRPAPDPFNVEPSLPDWLITYSDRDQSTVVEKHNAEAILYKGLFDFGNPHTQLTLRALENKYDEMVKDYPTNGGYGVQRHVFGNPPIYEWVGKWGWILTRYNNIQRAWDNT